MSAMQLQFMPFHNADLFKDHYLSEVLPASPLWDTAGMAEAKAAIAKLWEEHKEKAGRYNEGRLEEEFIRPVLRILGHVFDVQAEVGRHTADYAFFADQETKEAGGECETGTEEFWSHAVAVGDAKVWNRELDKRLEGGSGWDNQNPSFQICWYISQTNCKWGILTNGQHWRLYAAHSKFKLDVYYDVDLEQALSADDEISFGYFYLFFRREAFVDDAGGKCRLDKMREESDLAANRLRDNVRERMYEALRQACRGFLAYEANELTKDDLDAIHDNSLVLLYRLLFVLYAESKELLPVSGSGSYREEYSLNAIKQYVAGKGGELDAELATIWPRLTTLFRIVDRGHEGMGVPGYNGGLFNAQKYPFLEQHVLPDSYAGKLIDLVARTEDGGFVDYRDLGVRHLGSIYEGLLEYRVQVAEEPMRVVSRKGKQVWEPPAEEGEEDEETVQAGDIYLVTDKGERKATGSYYTPQFIVEYIVENTAGRLVEQCETAEEILEIDVVDPAMGSGHFLVEATDLLAQAIAKKEAQEEQITGSNGDDETDIARIKRQVVERCIYGVDLNPLAVELAKVSLWLHTVAKGQPLSFLDHHLRCGNSVIGAWLEEITGPLPTRKRQRKRERKEEEAGQLTLFDYAQWQRHVQGLVFGFTEIDQMLSATRGDIAEKERILADLDEAHRAPYISMGDLWCSRYFGNEFDGDAYAEGIGRLQGADVEVSESGQEGLDKSRKIAAERRFFHWELEFPEVFFDKHGRRREKAGFDAVIGNPPWERIKLQENEFFALRAPRIALAPTAARRKEMVAELPETDPELWEEYQRAKASAEQELAWTRASGQFPLMGRGDTNLYAVMAERARSLLNEKGRMGFVVPSGIATDNTTRHFFADLIETKTLQSLLDFENRARVFPDVDSRFKFSIIVLTGGTPVSSIESGFFLHNAEDIADTERVFELRPEDCELMNPNTRTCPIFRSRRDAEITRGIYERVPILVRETEEGEENPWGVRYFTMFHMTNDSGLFRTAEELEEDGFWLSAVNVWRKGEEAYLPLYVGKMVRAYDHRAASVEYHPENTFNPYLPVETSLAEKEDAEMCPFPQFWVPEEAVVSRGMSEPWVLAFRDIARATDERTVIAAAVPRAGFGNKLPLLLAGSDAKVCLLANLDALAFDYVVRAKIPATALNLFVIKQLPVLVPEVYEEGLSARFGGVAASPPDPLSETERGRTEEGMRENGIRTAASPPDPLSGAERGRAEECIEGDGTDTDNKEGRVMGAASRDKVRFAREQRQNPSAGETAVWEVLRGRQLGAKFRRQHPIGPFVLDFYCEAARLGVEIDGPHHQDTVEYDQWRDERLLNGYGIEVLRIAGSDVENDMIGVVERIRTRLVSGPSQVSDMPHAFPPSPSRRGGSWRGFPRQLRGEAGRTIRDFVTDRVLELTYTAHDIAGFAENMGYVDEEGKALPPFAWDEERRLHLKCQLDALYFHLYGLSREEAEYVLETFPIVKRHDVEEFGTYRTKELILHYYSAYAAGDMDAWVHV